MEGHCDCLAVHDWVLRVCVCAGSHRYGGLLGFGGAANVLSGEVDGLVQAGGAVLYDYRLVHRGTANVSTLERPVLQFVYYTAEYQNDKNFTGERLFQVTKSSLCVCVLFCLFFSS